jgi:hypothetical protein
MKVFVRLVTVFCGLFVVLLPLAANARWISVDPLASRYPSWSPYTYTLDNPLTYTDPDGQKVEFAQNQTQQFKNDFAAAMRYANSKGNGGTFGRLQKSGETVYISLPTSGSNADTYDPATKTIFWDPNQALQLTNGGSISPTTILIHEGGHAEGDISDPKAFLTRLTTLNSQYDNEEEKRVIQKIETPAAKKAGEDTRIDHSGTLVPVPDPTKRPTPPPPPPPPPKKQP